MLKPIRVLLQAIAPHFGDGRLVALMGNPISTIASPDGQQWSGLRKVAAPKTRQNHVLRRITYGNGRYVAIGDFGRCAVSNDGVSWTDSPRPIEAETLIDLAFGRGVFVGGGLHGLCLVSEDGLTWARRNMGEEGKHLNSVLWTGERFVAVSQGATYFSPDGLEWERRPNKNAPLTAAYGAGVFVGAHWKGACCIPATPSPGRRCSSRTTTSKSRPTAESELSG